MRMRQRARMRAAGDEASEMRHVDHQVSADFVGDGAQPREVDHARISRAAGDDDPRLVLPRQPLELVDVDALIVSAHAVMNGPEPFAGEIWRRAMRQVSAAGERQTKDRVAG